MRAAPLVLVVAVGCRAGAASPPPATASHTVIAPAPTERVDGVMLWPRPLLEAPAEVQARIALAQLLVDTVATAPRPRVAYPRDGDRWWTEMEAITAEHFAVYEQAVRAHVDGAVDDHAAAARVLASADEQRLYSVLVQLVDSHQRAVFLAERGIGRPAFGSCHNSPDESFGDALLDTERLAAECVELSPRVAGPLGTNLAECRRRAAWAEALIATGIDGVCEVEVPDY
jgi:hypothetical protein